MVDLEYKTIWKDGYIGYWNYKEMCWEDAKKIASFQLSVLMNLKDNWILD
ncbi:776_t:CDS:1, partial [Funneliformis mosseae]